jgi:hypothetical protein
MSSYIIESEEGEIQQTSTPSTPSSSTTYRPKRIVKQKGRGFQTNNEQRYVGKVNKKSNQQKLTNYRNKSMTSEQHIKVSMLLELTISYLI